MEIIRNPVIMRDTSLGNLLHSRSIGFVPTMGALHDGHLSLVRMSKEENTITVVSIYVNPLQFGPSEDFSRYPRQLEADIERLKKEEVDILFLPESTLIYPSGFSTVIDVKGVSDKLCGQFRPGHFSAVATVVAKLFNITRPARAYFGQKDFQQTVVIRAMTKDLNLDTEIVVCPTVREQDGLAMSSRNAYLEADQRTAATAIWRCLNEAAEAAKTRIKSGLAIRELMGSTLSKERLITAVDYAAVYDPKTLEEAEELRGDLLFAVAARLGPTRLIDNILVTI
jgi:pantoate--beta-alanine ligase